ncbi:ribosome recycling factor [Lyticum sinuosum]|uniref:Ribosome-recycling factor n=1 Tax=Lyticum sinuosum TaxID=1332059 RepID=A0AAE4VK50_9RICK|nr:ribosome recycling factor [Lyticum sinuosum]MDZ5761455.1 Ribosome-recycling factor [Lyticum sinuosum]
MIKDSKMSQEFPFIAHDIDDMNKRVDGAKNQLVHKLNSLRTGRASPSMVENIKVEVYGDLKKIKEISSITASDARCIVIKLWDKSLVKATEKAIRESGLGFNPIIEIDTLRVPVPDMTGDQRNLMVRKAKEYSEEAKVAIRNIRRDIIDIIKKLEKNKEVSEDDCKKASKKIQDQINVYIEDIDKLVKVKIQEIEI